MRVLLALQSLLILSPLALAQDPSITGRWKGPYETPVIGIHSVVLSDGNVLQWCYPTREFDVTDSAILDFKTKEARYYPVPRTMFCGGQSVLPDGRVLVTGGTAPNDGDDDFEGLKDTHLFYPSGESWVRTHDMTEGRWYPSHVALGDGRVLVFSGLDSNSQINPLVEIYDRRNSAEWSILTGAEIYLNLYPMMHLLPSGDVFCAGPQPEAGALNPATAQWRYVATSRFGYRCSGTSVLLPGLKKVMIIGGGCPVTETCEIIDLSSQVPRWRTTTPMAFPRSHGNPVLLPDGTLLVVGGEVDENTPVMVPEWFDPITEQWTQMAPMSVPRRYHSTCVLLADGSVLSAGTDLEFRVEIFKPPYLFRGPRPRIQNAPDTAVHGETFEIKCPEADLISRVVFMRPGATTHSINTEQRLIQAGFGTTGTTIRIHVPDNPNEMPPGYYMLFVVDLNGVPSRAKFIQIPD